MAGLCVTIVAGIEINSPLHVKSLLEKDETLKQHYTCITSGLTGKQYLGMVINPTDFVDINLTELNHHLRTMGQKVQSDPGLGRFIQETLRLGHRVKFDIFILDKNNVD